MQPQLEAQPGKAGLILGLASTALGTAMQAGVFKAPSPTVVLKNENPYVSVNSMNNVIIKNNTRFYDKKGFWYGVGVGTGILIPILINR